MMRRETSRTQRTRKTARLGSSAADQESISRFAEPKQLLDTCVYWQLRGPANTHA